MPLGLQCIKVFQPCSSLFVSHLGAASCCTMQGYAFLDSYKHGVDAAQARPRLNSAGKACDGAGMHFIPALAAKRRVPHGR